MDYAKAFLGLVSLIKTVVAWFRDREIRQQGFKEAMLLQYKKQELVRDSIRAVKKRVRNADADQLDRLRRRHVEYARRS